MEKQRSVLIAIISWFIIISSVFSVLSVLNEKPDSYNTNLSKYFYLVISPVSIIIAFNLLKLKEWARKGIIIVALLIAIETIISAPYAIKWMENNFSQGGDLYERLSIRMRERHPDLTEADIAKRLDRLNTKDMQHMIKTVICTLFSIAIALVLMFNIGIIYYFSRSRIKEKFS